MKNGFISRFRVVVGVVVLVVLSSVVSVAWKLIGVNAGSVSTIIPVQKEKIQKALNKRKEPVLVLPENAWVDSTLQSMSIEEKIGQLFMVATFSNKD